MDSVGADPVLSDVLWDRFDLQRSGNHSPVADLMIPCHKRDLAPSFTLVADLPVQGFLVGWPSPTGRSRFAAPGAAAAPPFAVFVGGVSGLADGDAEGGGVMRHLGNEGGTPNAGGLLEPLSASPSHTS